MHFRCDSVIRVFSRRGLISQKIFRLKPTIRKLLIMNEIFFFFKCADVQNVKFLIPYNRYVSLTIFPGNDNPGSKMTISGRPEIGLEDVLWTLAAHRIDVLRMYVDPKMIQILTKIFKTL